MIFVSSRQFSTANNDIFLTLTAFIVFNRLYFKVPVDVMHEVFLQTIAVEIEQAL